MPAGHGACALCATFTCLRDVDLHRRAGVAGIYFVSTAPAFRRRGIGAWITRAAFLEARAFGYATGVLGSSPLGYSVYRRLGFEELPD